MYSRGERHLHGSRRAAEVSSSVTSGCKVATLWISTCQRLGEPCFYKQRKTSMAGGSSSAAMACSAVSASASSKETSCTPSARCDCSVWCQRGVLSKGYLLLHGPFSLFTIYCIGYQAARGVSAIPHGIPARHVTRYRTDILAKPLIY